MSNEMVFCTQCGRQIQAGTKFCPNCGAIQPDGIIEHATTLSSQSENVAVIPEGVKGWSWGAFLLNWIWAIGNKTWIGFLVLIPVINIFMVFVLGFKGREWAWKNKTWRDLEHFNQVQRKWNIAGFIVLAIALPLGFAVGYLQENHASFIEEKTPVADKLEDERISLDVKPGSIDGANYGLSYHAPKLAFDPKALYDELKRNDLTPFVTQTEKYLVAPHQFISDCVNSGAEYSHKHGGLSEKEARDWGINSCKDEIQQYQQCVGQTELENAVACFRQIAEQGD